MVLFFSILFSLMTLLSLMMLLYPGLRRMGTILAVLNIMMLFVMNGLQAQYFVWFSIAYIIATSMTLRIAFKQKKKAGVAS